MARLNRLYGKLKTREDWLYTEDFTFRGTPQLDPSSTTIQKVDVVFDNVNLNLSEIQGANAAYLVLRHLYVAVRKNRVYQESLKGYSWSNFQTHSVPSSAVNDVFNYTITGLPYDMTQLKKLLFSTVTTGITIKTVRIKSTVQSEWVNLALAPITAPSGIDMESIFGPGGFHAHSRNVTGEGIDIEITADNTAGAKDYSFVAYGQSDTSQTNQWLVQYQDRTQQLHNIGIFDDLQFAKDFQVDRIIPVAITDPTRKDFGQVIFSPVIAGEDYYVTGDQYNVVLNCSIAYLLPEDVVTRDMNFSYKENR